MFIAIPHSWPSSSETEQLVHRIRNDMLPCVESASGIDVSVASSTSCHVDTARQPLSEALPVFMLIVIGLTLLLLLVALTRR